MRKFSLFWPILIIAGGLWPLEVHAQGPNARANVVAKAGDEYITEKEFVDRFELLPGLQRQRTGRLEEAKLELLYSLIAEKLMAQEARERKLDQDPSFRSSYEEVRKMLARDQLYREEVAGKVRVTSIEMAEGVSQALKEVLISFIYFDRKADAEFVRMQMMGPKDFDSMQIDTSLHAVRDTATIIWSDATPSIERAAYSMKENEISPVIAAGEGFYILKVARIRRNAFYASLQPSVLRERVEERIRERKERARLNEFVASALKQKTGYARPEPLRELARALERAFRASALDGKVALSEEMLNSVKKECAAVAVDTIAVAGERSWTVGEIADRLYETGFTVDSSTIATVPQHLNEQLRVWVEQELLGQEAIARGLDKYPSVREELTLWYDNFLEQSMRFYLKKQVRVSDAEVLSAMRLKDSAVAVPRVQIRELRTASLDDMQQALNDIQKGTSMVDAIRRWCSDPALRGRNGVSDPFLVSERYPVGEIASHMQVGQRYGPLKDGSAYLYFELLSKDARPEPNDTGYVARKRRTTLELLRQKEKRLVDLFIAKAGESRGYAIFQDRLRQIKVSPIPMMTFRILGFGGRMFAVPFVDRQIEWLNVEPPKGQIVF